MTCLQQIHDWSAGQGYHTGRIGPLYLMMPTITPELGRTGPGSGQAILYRLACREEALVLPLHFTAEGGAPTAAHARLGQQEASGLSNSALVQAAMSTPCTLYNPMQHSSGAFELGLAAYQARQQQTGVPVEAQAAMVKAQNAERNALVKRAVALQARMQSANPAAPAPLAQAAVRRPAVHPLSKHRQPSSAPGIPGASAPRRDISPLYGTHGDEELGTASNSGQVNRAAIEAFVDLEGNPSPSCPRGEGSCSSLSVTTEGTGSSHKDAEDDDSDDACTDKEESDPDAPSWDGVMKWLKRWRVTPVHVTPSQGYEAFLQDMRGLALAANKTDAQPLEGRNDWAIVDMAVACVRTEEGLEHVLQSVGQLAPGMVAMNFQGEAEFVVFGPVNQSVYDAMMRTGSVAGAPMRDGETRRYPPQRFATGALALEDTGAQLAVVEAMKRAGGDVVARFTLDRRLVLLALWCLVCGHSWASLQLLQRAGGPEGAVGVKRKFHAAPHGRYDGTWVSLCIATRAKGSSTRQKHVTSCLALSVHLLLNPHHVVPLNTGGALSEVQITALGLAHTNGLIPVLSAFICSSCNLMGQRSVSGAVYGDVDSPICPTVYYICTSAACRGKAQHMSVNHDSFVEVMNKCMTGVSEDDAQYKRWEEWKALKLVQEEETGALTRNLQALGVTSFDCSRVLVRKVTVKRGEGKRF